MKRSAFFFAAAAVVAVAVLYAMKNFSILSFTPTTALQALAQAIAAAENSPVAQTNNPGDLALGDVGNGVFNSAGVSIFSTIEEGWNALYNELNLIVTGASKYYSPSMTIAELAQQWTGGDNAAGWAQTVAQSLGVTVNTTIADALAAQGGS